MGQPEILTERLKLRQFTIEDAKKVQILAGQKEVSNVTANIPTPYPDGLAEKWIAQHDSNFISGSLATYAITLRENSELIGCVSMLNLNSEMPELGYWVGLEFWGNGYCTEACIALINFCESAFGLKSIYGKHLSRNPASGRVMEKCGLSYLSKDIGKNGFMEHEEEFKIYRKICV